VRIRFPSASASAWAAWVRSRSRSSAAPAWAANPSSSRAVIARVCPAMIRATVSLTGTWMGTAAGGRTR